MFLKSKIFLAGSLLAILLFSLFSFNAPVLADSNSTGWKLPFDIGSRVYTTQGYNGPYSHNGQKALDFVNLSQSSSNTSILAAKGGKIFNIQQGGIYDSWCSSFSDCSTKGNISGGNYIIIDHLDGTYSYYVHLRAGSILIKKGDTVVEGQKLALMGGTGYTCGNEACTTPGPHLHFQASQNGQYLDTPFGDCGCIPIEGQTVTVSNKTIPAVVTPPPISTPSPVPQPRSVFIHLTSDLTKTLDVAGGSMADQTRVLLWPIHGGSNQQWVYYPETQEIKNRGMCLDGGNTDDYNNRSLRISKCHGGNNQKWFLTGGNELKVYSNINICADYPSNNNYPINLGACYGTWNQSWVIQ